MDIAFIGFGGAAFGLAKGLKQDGVANVFFYDPASSKPPYDQVVARRADETGAIGRDTLEELIASADVVISCVTGSVAASAARDAAPHLRPGQLYVDVNTASPDVMEQAAASVAGAGAVFVDAAMMGGIPTYLHKVPTLASGAGAERFKELLSPYNMSITVLGDKPGQASAIKMFRSIFMKGVLGLLLEVMEASNKYDASDLVLSSVAGTMDKTPFLETARLIATKGVVNAERMAHEMEDVVKTIERLGAAGTMSDATRQKLEWCAGLGLKERFKGEIPETLADILPFL